MAQSTAILSLLFISFAFSARGDNAGISFNFPSFPSSPPEIKFENDAAFSNGSLELNYNGANSYGRAVYREKVRIWYKNSEYVASFRTRFSFSVVRTTNQTDHADGFAFFLMPVDYPVRTETTGGPLTLFSNATMSRPERKPAVAVEFDTYQNSWDPNYTHIGIDVGYIRSNRTLPWDPFQGRSSFNAYAEIVYDARSQILRANFLDGWGNQGILDAVVDLRKVLDEEVSVGFAGSTGESFQNHSIHSWSFSSAFVFDNIGVNTIGGPAPAPTKPPEKKSNAAAAVVGGLAAAAVLVTALMWFLARRRRAGGTDESGIDVKELEDGKGPGRFSYAELARATRNFSQEQKLGRGGFGDVYKGILSDPATAVAVKRVAKDSRQGKKEFLAEVKIISRLRHRNLVKLLGWCHERGELLLVYEYMPNGSLDGHLFGRTSLPWPARYAIAKGVASALMYLHEEWEQCVIHRDIKSSNVMLDGSFTAKLGDLGLSRLAEHGGGMETTVAAGTLGYIAPETAMTGRASKESDVYSFGVLALEIACGRKPIEQGRQTLVEWVWDLHGKGAVLEAADDRLGADFDRREMKQLLVVGLWCAHPSYMDRPTMGRAIGVLMFDMPLPDLPTDLPALGYGGIALTGLNLASIRGFSSFAASGASAGFNSRSFDDSAEKSASKPFSDRSSRSSVGEISGPVNWEDIIRLNEITFVQ